MYLNTAWEDDSIQSIAKTLRKTDIIDTNICFPCSIPSCNALVLTFYRDRKTLQNCLILQKYQIMLTSKI